MSVFLEIHTHMKSASFVLAIFYLRAQIWEKKIWVEHKPQKLTMIKPTSKQHQTSAIKKKSEK